MGAWIETEDLLPCIWNAESHPTWVRGLKPRYCPLATDLLLVAPYVGAWIETGWVIYEVRAHGVAPYVGAWIETTMNVAASNNMMSHPTWVRGLKLKEYVNAKNEKGRTLRGCVD